MSSDRENDFFADGITEDILNALSHIRELRVVGRTSAFAFKERKQDLRAIARELHVHTVLDGSVRRVGDHVRITAQLLDVADGHQLWSERYDREMRDVFAVQDEIATAIALRMKAEIEGTHAVALAGRPTDNIDAYQAYLKGRALLDRRGTSIKQGMALMETALSLDPDYGLALSGLADAHTLRGMYALAPTHEVSASARSLAERALKVAPDVAEANASLAMVRLMFDWRFDDAQQLFSRALDLNPGYIQGAVWYNMFYLGSVCGRWAEAIDQVTQIEKLDRLSGYIVALLSVAHTIGGDLDEALRWSNRALELDADSYLTLWTRQAVFARRRDWPMALEASDALLVAFGRRPNTLVRLCAVFVEQGQLEEARSVYQELRARASLSRSGREYVSPVALAAVASAVGETKEAIAAARDAFALREPQMILLGRTWPEFQYLRPLPEFQAILAEMRLPGLESGAPALQ